MAINYELSLTNLISWYLSGYNKYLSKGGPSGKKYLILRVINVVFLLSSLCRNKNLFSVELKHNYDTWLVSKLNYFLQYVSDSGLVSAMLAWLACSAKIRSHSDNSWGMFPDCMVSSELSSLSPSAQTGNNSVKRK